MKRFCFGLFLLLASCFCFVGADDLSRRRSLAARCFGSVELVNYSPDFRVRVVGVNADLRVLVVNGGDADSVGEWDIRGINPRYRVQLVDYGEDFTIQFVSDNPGLND